MNENSLNQKKWPDWILFLASIAIVTGLSALASSVALKTLAQYDKEPMTSQLALMLWLSFFNLIWGLFIAIVGLAKLRKIRSAG